MCVKSVCILDTRSANMTLTYAYVYFSLIYIVSGSTLPSSPISALVVAFEKPYDLSLLAGTLAIKDINTTLLVTSITTDLSDDLHGVNVIRLPVVETDSAYKMIGAIHACESFLTDKHILNKLLQIQPNFVIFPTLWHDACLLPWVKSIKSIPVLWVQSRDNELYTFHHTDAAIQIYTGEIWTRLTFLYNMRYVLHGADILYVVPALQLIEKHLPNADSDFDNLYSDINLILWNTDPIFRSDYAVVNKLLVEVGCHHCREYRSLSMSLEDDIIDHRFIVIVLLDEQYKQMILDMVEHVHRTGRNLGVLWNTKDEISIYNRPGNLFIYNKISRQDLIGYVKTRMLLSHCSDSELMEAAFHGIPVICIPRDEDESKNAVRAIELGFAYPTQDDFSSEAISNAINQIHSIPKYRKSAKKISLAIRDKPNSAADRIVYWLEYTMRNNEAQDETSVAIRNRKPLYYRRTFNVDLWFVIGFLVGVTAGLFIPIIYGCADIWIIHRRPVVRTPRSRRKYIKRH